MDIGLHDLAALFGQLGLANDEPNIRQFIESHQLAAGSSLLEAPFWNSSQVELLQQAFIDGMQKIIDAIEIKKSKHTQNNDI